MDGCRRPESEFRAPASNSARILRRTEGAKPRILLVEDHAESAAALALLLRGEGYEVCIASTVVQALQLALENDIDLVITDLRLPDGDGSDLMAQLHYRHNLVGIAVTGNAHNDDPVYLSTSGFINRLTKPIDVPELFAVIKQATGPSN